MTATDRRTPLGRRRSGELRCQVAHVLEYAPTAFTVNEVAHQVGASSGAAGNALETLVRNGHAEVVQNTPRKFRRTETTHLAATRIAATESKAEKAPAPAAAPAASAPVRRPGGQDYHPRDLAGQSDVAVLQRLRAAEVPVLLYGPPGTGKTSLAEAAFPDLITLAGDGDTTVGDLVGEYIQRPDGGFEFQYGPLVRAMQEGRALLIDDATLISPAVLAVAYPAMDGRRKITVTAHKGETITAAEGFYVVAGHNPGVHGALLSEALASRFLVHIEVTSDYDLAKSLGVNNRAVRAARNLAKKLSSGEIGWAPQLRELLAFQKTADLLGVEAAVANLAGIAPSADRDTVTACLSDVFGFAVIPLRLGRQI